jgi:ABC-type polysaccharide/polyol phosphate transport system ATPase subunit
MASVRAFNVSVSYPVFTAASRSLKSNIVSQLTGGKISAKSSRHVEVEALNHVTFTLEPGDRVALIGGNGSGKSTLLRTMARIYHPTFGRMQIDGKVAALFDTTFGLDLEATGYENIYLRSLLLGIGRNEIGHKIDDIAEFSGLSGFLDMPLRTHSAGMVARLAFAISTAIDAEILLIDEGIGTADESFMRKADQRLAQFVDRAPIVVMATHKEEAIRKFCNRGIVLKCGRVVFDGEIDDAYYNYRASQQSGEVEHAVP